MTVLEKTTDICRLPPEAEGGIRRLQIGCGPQHIRADWWNTDLRAFPGIDEALDATRPWRWEDLLDAVYAEHFLEHLDIEGALAFLVNSGRALRKGGTLRLSTPALEWVWVTHLRLPGNSDDALVSDTLAANRAFHGWGHQFLWSKAMLARALSACGFEDIRFCAYGESEVAGLAGIELHRTRPDADGYPCVWCVEATRGETPIAIDPVFADLVESAFMSHVRAGH